MSESRGKLQDEYVPIAEQFCYDHPECQIQAPGCTFYTEGVHHPYGKEGYDEDGTHMLLAVRHFMGACNWCNLYVEVHDAWAREKGFKKQRIK